MGEGMIYFVVGALAITQPHHTMPRLAMPNRALPHRASPDPLRFQYITQSFTEQ